MGFLKLQGIREVDGKPLHWGRASLDFAPFRGEAPTLLKSAEAEAYLQRTSDTFYGTFDTSTPEQKVSKHTLQEVLDRAQNGWYNIIAMDKQWGTKDGLPVMFVFVIWNINYMELDRSAAPASVFPGVSDVNVGSSYR